MEVFFHATQQMLVLFLLLLIGVLARKLGFMGDDFDKKLSALVMNFALPAMILGSVLNSDSLPDAPTIAVLFCCSALAYIVIVAAALLLPRLLYRRASASEQGAHSFIIAFGNVGFVGFPVLRAILGEQAVFYGAVYNIPFNLFAFTIGAMMVKRGTGHAPDAGEPPSPKGKRAAEVARSIISPCMVSCLIAIVLALLGITDNNGIIGMSCDYLGQLTVPGSMLVMGSTLGKMSPSSMLGHMRPYISSAFRLLGVPLLVYAVFRLFITDSLVLGVLTMSSAMPVASMGIMLCLVHGGDEETMSRGTFITTVLSIVTIPLMALLVV